MANNPKNQGETNPKGKGRSKFSFYWIYGIVLLGLLGLQFLNFNSAEDISQKRFEQDMLATHEVEKIEVVNGKHVQIFITPEALKQDKYKDVRSKRFGGGSNSGPHYQFEILDPGEFKSEMNEFQKDWSDDEKIEIYAVTKTDWTGQILSWVLPILIIVAIWIFIMRRVSSGGGVGGAGGQIFNIGKSKASLYDKNTQVEVTFDDVAGLEEAKEEVVEVVDFLKHPEKYTALGGKIPKGVLLVGPPGTGKTLIAKAMAGEARVPFFTISGSDFVEMFVGVGASRVRDLFKQAREKAPCIIFIDEIDAIGRARGKQLIQGNDERENTLNQLLVEMDGFSTDKGVIIVAATNRPDILDIALLRPGRFDRTIAIDKPDLKAREEIFKVHIKSIKIGKEVTPEKLAQQTPGFVGADITNICNEAALIAARKEKKAVDMIDFQDAIDRSIGGLERKNKLISPDEKKIIANHEAGHAICGWFLPHADPLVKVSIVPRGVAALGYAQYLPKEQYLMNIEQLEDQICKILGGRAAEELIFGRISTGAQNDLDQVTKIAYGMVTVYGMNEKIGNVSFLDMQNEYGFSKPYSDETAFIIDQEVKKMIGKQYQRALDLLLDKKADLKKLANALLDKEVLFQDDLIAMIGPPPKGKKIAMPELLDKKDEIAVEDPVVDLEKPEEEDIKD